jgi:hypothetical protein
MGVPHRALDLRRVPSDLTISLHNTDTNSTSLSVGGPGQAISALFGAGGRHLESLVSRAAERLGYGPNAAVQRLVAALHASHVRACREERTHTAPGSPLRRGKMAPRPTTFDTAALVDELVALASSVCPSCRRPSLLDAELPPEAVHALQKLLVCMRKRNPSARHLATYYLHALAATDEKLRQCMLRSGAVSILEDTVLHSRLHGWADIAWAQIEYPARTALAAMLVPVAWTSLFDVFSSREHTSSNSHERLAAEMTALLAHDRCVRVVAPPRDRR